MPTDVSKEFPFARLDSIDRLIQSETPPSSVRIQSADMRDAVVLVLPIILINATNLMVACHGTSPWFARDRSPVVAEYS